MNDAPQSQGESPRTDPLEPDAPATEAVAADVDAADETPATKAKPKKKRRTWRQRIWLTFLVLLFLAVTFRVALSIAFPIVLKKVAAGYGLDASYEHLTLSLTGGDVGIGKLKFVPVGSTEPFLSTDYVRATITPLKLFVGKLEVWRVETDGIEINIDREADGSMPVIDKLLASATPKDAATSKAAEPAKPPSQINLTSPAQIDGFRLHHVLIRMRDKSMSPPLNATVRIDVRVDDIGTGGQPAKFKLNVYCDPNLDALEVTGTGQSAGAYLDANVDVNVKGLHLKPLAGYLEPLGIRPIADSIHMAASGRVRTTPADLAKATLALATASTQSTQSGAASATAPSNVASRHDDSRSIPADAKPADSIACLVEFNNLTIHTDGDEAAAVDRFVLDAKKIGGKEAKISQLVIDGVRAGAKRTEKGDLRLAGIELFPVAAKKKPVPTSKPAVDGKPADSSTAAAPFIASLDLLAIRNVKLSVADQFVEPPAELALHMDELTVRDLVLDPAKPDAQVKIAGAFRAPGIAKTARFNGTVKPFAKTASLDLTFAADGINFGKLRPYLDLVGLESRLENASFTASLSASASVDDKTGVIAADARLGDIAFTDKQKLFGLDEVRFDGVTLNPETGLLKLGEIAVRGPALDVIREADGSLSALGFHTKTPVKGRTRELPPEEPTQIKLAKVELGKFTWKDVKIGFEDRAVSPVEKVEIGDLGVEVANVKLDFENKSPGSPGTIRAWLAAPKIAEKLELNGTVTPTLENVKLDVTATGSGITAAGIAGYLKSLGIEPLLKDGSFTAHLAATLEQTTAGALKASLQIDGVKYADGATELAGVDLLKVDGVHFDGKARTLSVDLVQIDRPRTSLLRESGGARVVGGFRLIPPATQPANPTATTASVTPTTQPAVATTATPATGPAIAGESGTARLPAAAGAAEPPPWVATLKELKINQAALAWSDRATTRPVDTTARVDLSLSSVTLGPDAGPAELSVTLKVDEVLDRATVSGKLFPGPALLGAALKVDAAGVTGSALAPYLPPGARFTLKDGRFHTEIDASIEPTPEGVHKIKLAVNGVDWRDGADGVPMLKLGAFRIAAPRVELASSTIPILGVFRLTIPRVDRAGDSVTIDEITLEGLEVDAGKSTDGAFRAMGLAFSSPSPDSGGAATSAAPAPADPSPATAPSVAAAPANAAENPGAVAAAQPATAPTNPGTPSDSVTLKQAGPVSAGAAATLAQQAKKVLPLVTLNKLDLNVRQIRYHDESVKNTQPLTVTNLRLRSLDKIEALGKDPTSNPPMKIEITGRADPLIGGIKVDTVASPFAQDPKVEIDVLLSEIRGDGIFALAPQLREKIDGSRLTQGQFKTHLEATLKVERRGPADVEFFGKGFEVQEALVKDTAFRAQPDGRVLLGLNELRVENVRVKPKEGSVKVKQVDLVKPIAFMTREKEGIHAAGLVLKTPATQPTADTAAGGPTAAPATPPADAPPAAGPVITEAPAASPASQPAVAQKPAGEVSIDKLTIAGIDVRIEDNSVDPAVILPLTEFDFEARGISSLAMQEERRIRFAMSVNAGKFDAPKKVQGGVIGAVGDVVGLIGGAGKPPPPPESQETEQREVFSQIAASGEFALYPKPTGWLKSNITGFEITSIRGLAKEKGVTLSYGAFDVSSDIRARGNGDIDIVSRPFITDLSMKDSPDGYIVRYIPGIGNMSLSAAITFVEAADKSISLPINVTAKPLPDGSYDLAGLRDTALKGVGEIVLKASLGAPQKIAGGALAVTGVDKLLGIGGQKKPDEPVVLAFPAGATGLESADQVKLAALAELMKRQPDVKVTLKHDLGGGDLKLAEMRANPPTADADAIAASLHRRKVALTRVRGEAAAEARFRLASGAGPEATAAVERLRAIDRDLARTEDALDRTYDLLRPGADRQASRRTRAASVEIARDRLDTVRQSLSVAGVPNPAERVTLSAPQATASDDPAAGGVVTILLVREKK